MWKSCHCKASMGNVDLASVIGHDFVSSIDTKSICFVAGKQSSCFLNALMQNELMNFPHIPDPEGQLKALSTWTLLTQAI
jgi:hypothetical protein